MLHGDNFYSMNSGASGWEMTNTIAESRMDRLPTGYKWILLKGHFICYNIESEKAEI